MTDETKTTTLPVGSVIILHTGEYSDKQARGPYKTLKPFNGDELVFKFISGWVPKWEGDETPDPSEFDAWLFTAGYLEPIENVTHWHIGSYGRLEPSHPWYSTEINP